MYTHALPLVPSPLPLCSPYSWVDSGQVHHSEPWPSVVTETHSYLQVAHAL